MRKIFKASSWNFVVIYISFRKLIKFRNTNFYRDSFQRLTISLEKDGFVRKEGRKDFF